MTTFAVALFLFIITHSLLPQQSFKNTLANGTIANSVSFAIPVSGRHLQNHFRLGGSSGSIDRNRQLSSGQVLLLIFEHPAGG
jgi:hypothetical protein